MPLLAGQVPGRGQPGQRLALGFTLWGWDEAPCVMLCRAGGVARHLAVGWLAAAAKAAGSEGISAGLSLVCLLLGPGKLPRYLQVSGPGLGLGLEPGTQLTRAPWRGLGASP